ncbi:4'-phosphopantetheinyl transferase superfamily [Thermoascus aurantiacus ATCC 26904]
MKPLPFPYALNIGTDIVHLPRILRVISRPGVRGTNSYLERFTRRILCEQELSDFRARFPQLHATSTSESHRRLEVSVEMARWLAGRFAAKEAARKAAPGGASSIGWKDVLVRAEETGAGPGRPEVVYLNRNGEGEGGGRVGKLSISHDGEYVVATVLAAS